MKLRVCAIFATLLSASPVLASCGNDMPPPSAQKPVTEPFQVFFVPDDQMADWCNKAPGVQIDGCTYLANSQRSAVIYINAGLGIEDTGCTLIYEKAHLKPNNWIDRGAEASVKNLPGVSDAAAGF